MQDTFIYTSLLSYHNINIYNSLFNQRIKSELYRQASPEKIAKAPLAQLLTDWHQTRVIMVLVSLQKGI